MINEHLKVCREILPKVSRSFALCIRKLPPKLADQMMVSYLIFRVLDTIEDSNAPLGTKERGFSEFLGILRGGPAQRGVFDEHRDFLLHDISHSYERPLLEEIRSLFELFYGLGEREKGAILECAEEMARGMTEFQKRTITDFKAQDEYCHYVAGIVGHLNTRLFHLYGAISAGLRDALMVQSNNFGLALQKVNVIRDVAHDLPRGRRYWPLDLLRRNGLEYDTLCSPRLRPNALNALEEAVGNAMPYLDDAVEYVTRLPRMAVRIRVFCLIPLFMALKSLALCVGNPDVFDAGKLVKISRRDVERIAQKSFLFAMSDGAIRRWHQKSLSSATGGAGKRGAA